MAKFYGPIGYATTVETSPGIHTEEIVERNYFGDLLRHNSSWANASDSTNDDLKINVQISILADPFAYQNFHSIKYVGYMGTKWKVTSIDVQDRRLILNVGGVYTNG